MKSFLVTGLLFSATADALIDPALKTFSNGISDGGTQRVLILTKPVAQATRPNR